LPAVFAVCRKSYNRAIGRSSQQQRLAAVDMHGSWTRPQRIRPPESTKPWCYWYWISDNISKEGISRDLESMARVGIGEAIIGNIFLEDVPAGDVKALSEPWWEMVEHAIREAGRVGVRIAMFNCPGWSQSGGPWIQPDQAMRYLASSEIRVQGPVAFTGPLPVPATPFPRCRRPGISRSET
jgi:hypothetical protein